GTADLRGSLAFQNRRASGWRRRPHPRLPGPAAGPRPSLQALSQTDRAIGETQLVAVPPRGMHVVDLQQAADADDLALLEAVPGVLAGNENGAGIEHTRRTPEPL